MSTMDDWLTAVARELGLDPAELDSARVLDLTRDVAHQVARPAAPLTAYLLGVATGRGMDERQSAARLGTLAARWKAAEGGGEPEPGPSADDRHLT